MVVARVFDASAFILFFSILCFGCKNKLVPGHYEGNLLKKETNNYVIEPVQLDISYLHSQGIKVEVKSQKKNINAQLSLTRLKPKVYLLEGSSPFPEKSYVLNRLQTKVDDYKCYVSTSTPKVEMCYNNYQFYIKFIDQQSQPLITLSGIKFKNEPPFELEPPEEMTLSDSIKRVLSKSYESRIGFEQAFQAKNAALAAWLNLIPHLTTNLIWNVPPNYISALATIQAIAPFLLPTYWMEAKTANLNQKIQQDSLIILLANLASNLEQLFYAYDRDSNILKVHEKFQSVLSKFASKHSSSPNLIQLKNTLSETINSTQQGIERILKEDGYAISKTLGMHNPNSVSGVILGKEYLPFSEAQPIDQFTTAQWASQRSFELEQLDYLIQISHIKKDALFFAWIDPTADQRTNFGFNLIGQVKMASSQIDELKLKREQLKSIIYHNAYLIALDYNLSLQNIQTASIPSVLETKLKELEIQLEELSSQSQPDSGPIKTWIQKTLGEYVQYQTLLSAFRTARAKKDRILLSGYFEQLLPQLPSLSIPMQLK